MESSPNSLTVSDVAPSAPKGGHLSKQRLVKNLVVLSVAWWMLFSAYDGLLILQSTLNSKKGVGVISVSIQYAMGCATAVLLPKYLITKLGHKSVIVWCIALHIPFIAANFYPSWGVMVPTSVLLGGANPLLWAALCSYLNNLSSLYSAHLQKASRSDQSGSDLNRSNSDLLKGSSNFLESTTARFFGFHGAVYMSCHVSSNLVSYYILSMGVAGDAKKNSKCTCGIDFCVDNADCLNNGNLKPPSDAVRYVLTAVCVVLGLVAVALVALFMDGLDEKKKKGSDTTMSLDFLMATCRLMKQAKLLSLIPLSIYIGVFQGFVMGDYTQAYVGCAWGIPYIGLETAMLGLTLSLGSTLSGWLVRFVGRMPIFLTAEALNIAYILVLFLVPPDGDRPALMLAMGAISGAVLGAFWAQIRAFYGVLFKEDEEAGFGNYQLWHSVGVCISFGSSKYLCTSVKVYILILCSTLGILGYLLGERCHSRELKEKG